MEGLPFISGFAGAALLIYYFAEVRHSLCLTVLASLALFLAFFSAYFFRNPSRRTPSVDGGIISPADGTVIFIGDVTEEHLGVKMTKISIFMSVFNVHINRAPITGKIIDNFYIQGKFLDVRDERATFENERNGLVLETAKGLKLVVVQVAGLIARRIVSYPVVGDMMIQGQRYGLIRFGSRLDVFMPLGSQVKVAMGEKCVAGETILGILP